MNETWQGEQVSQCSTYWSRLHHLQLGGEIDDHVAGTNKIKDR